MDPDDGLMLNLVPFTRKTKDQNKTQKVLPSDSKRNSTTEVQKVEKLNKKNTGKYKESNQNDSKQKRKYIDPKDFVPVSSLFNKNPDIPTHISSQCKQKAVATFASESIDDLDIETRIKENLKQLFNFKTLTKIQQKAIPTVLSTNDVMIKSVTGSGKTMCYAVPIMHMLSQQTPPVCRKDGVFALILLPTRELANQTYDVFTLLCRSFINIIPGILIGGEKCKAEKARLRKGINILIATPGRFDYHLKETKCLDVSKLSYIVFDEADKLLDMGYEKTLNSILKTLKERVNIKGQNILLSATLSSKIHNLASVCLQDPVFIDASNEKENMEQNSYLAPSSLTQFYVTVPAKLRLVCLVGQVFSKVFYEHGKAIVFAANKMTVIFLHNVFKNLVTDYFDIDKKMNKFVLQLHGDMDQAKRKATFEEFKNADSSVLFTTDVAARGLDIRKINWIFQYSCPTEIENYLHRVGRTARIGEKGQSLLFLLPSEINYLIELEKLSIPIENIELETTLKEVFSKMSIKSKNFQEDASRLQEFIEEKIIKGNVENHEIAVKAFQSYIKSYATYSSDMKNIFHVKFLHLGHLAKSYGLREAPTKFANQNTTSQSRKKSRKVLPSTNNVVKKRKLNTGENDIVNGPRTKKFMRKK